jgi:hypothetical protein
MVVKGSRYAGLADVVERDPRNPARTVAAKGLRLLPQVSGEFRHTLAEGERLDHLAAKYYRDPRRWWRICDANPEFLSPLELIGGGPLRTLRVPLGSRAATHDLVTRLEAELGVVRFRFLDDPNSDTGTVEVTYNRFLLEPASLVELVGPARAAAAEPRSIGRAGKQITIPPDAVR